LPFLRMPGGQGVVGSNPASPTYRRRSGPCAGPPAGRGSGHVAMRRGSPSSATVRPRSFRLQSGRLRTLADDSGSVVTSSGGQEVTPSRTPAAAGRRRASGDCFLRDKVVVSTFVSPRSGTRVKVDWGWLGTAPRRGWRRLGGVDRSLWARPPSVANAVRSSSSLATSYPGHSPGEVAPRVYTTH